MTKRHPGLIPLTHDHHHALGQARRLKLAAASSDRERLDQAKEFVSFFRADTVAHFREEEELVFPLAVTDPRASELLSRVMIEHLQIHALVASLEDQVAKDAVTKESATSTAEALEAHIRLEEGQVFPLVEQVVSDAELAHLSLRPRDRTEPTK